MVNRTSQREVTVNGQRGGFVITPLVSLLVECPRLLLQISTALVPTRWRHHASSGGVTHRRIIVT